MCWLARADSGRLVCRDNGSEPLLLFATWKFVKMVVGARSEVRVFWL